MQAHTVAESCSGRGGNCVEWIRRYLKDCVCSKLDAISFGVGLASVICWGVAEVPQIFTNFREGSTEGISLIFLMTWVIGDAFNLIGCYLEPSTLPTQFYMALLYTITTLILVGQVVYYQHYLKWKKGHMVTPAPPPMKPEVIDNESKGHEPVPEQKISQPIAYAPSPTRGQLYYTSARSLASSHTPTAGSYLAAGSRGSYPSLIQHNSLDGFHESEPIPITSRSAPAPVVASGSPTSILRAVISVGICAGGLNLSRGFRAMHRRKPLLETSGNYRVFSKRKLLQIVSTSSLRQENEMGESVGMWLGWMMAAIYMGGRLPQIILNIKRGSVEGLNPLMFTFALLGNVTYVASILIRSTEWRRIKANMPWLVDAGVCVVLDCFILCQFFYYCTKRGSSTKDDSSGDYKSLASSASKSKVGSNGNVDV